MENALMPLAEAARLLGLTTGTLRHQIRMGVLKATKLGRDWHVSTGEVERYAQEHKGKTFGRD